MKIAISSLKNSDFNEIALITFPVMAEYCLRHDYTFSPYFSHLQSPEIVWKRLDRVIALQESHDVVVHMDADVLITNLTSRIEDMIRDDKQDVATAENGIINDGVFIWAESEWPKRLNTEEVRAIYSSPQDAINSKYGAQMDMRVYPPRFMNSILNAEYGLVNPLSEWQQGDFCLHLPALGNVRRVEILNQTLPKITR